jgi:hypothetical protein
MSFRDPNASTVTSQATVQTRSKFGPCRRPRKPYSGLARRRCRKLRLGLPITPDHSVIQRWGSRYLQDGSNSEPVHNRPVVVREVLHLTVQRVLLVTKLDQLGSEWEEGYFLAQAVFSTQTHCLAFTAERQ